MNIRNLLSKTASVFSTKQLISLTQQPVFLPFYHTISNESRPHIAHLYPLRSVELFEQDLDFFVANYSAVSIDELFAITENSKPEKAVFHLTFDDGLSEIYSIIAPLLEKRGIPATFFINTDFLDNKDLFYRYKISLIIDAITQNPQLTPTVQSQLGSQNNVVSTLRSLKFQDIDLINSVAKSIELDFEEFLSKTQPYLTYEQVADLIKRGFSIGSHSKNHPLFASISFEEQQRQITDSFDSLCQIFGIKSRFFAFPFTDDGVSANFISWMHEQQHCKLTFGTAGLKQDFSKYHLQRTPIEGNLQPAESIVKAEYLYYFLKSFVGKNKLKRV